LNTRQFKITLHFLLEIKPWGQHLRHIAGVTPKSFTCQEGHCAVFNAASRSGCVKSVGTASVCASRTHQEHWQRCARAGPRPRGGTRHRAASTCDHRSRCSSECLQLHALAVLSRLQVSAPAVHQAVTGRESDVRQPLKHVTELQLSQARDNHLSAKRNQTQKGQDSEKNVENVIKTNDHTIIR
jgi:hypothetical protein